MITFKLDDRDQVELTINDNGLATLATVSTPVANGQLARLRLLTPRHALVMRPVDAIDWFGLLESPQLISVLGTKIRVLLESTEGVSGADLSRAKYTLNPHPIVTGICFTLDCGTEQELVI